MWRSCREGKIYEHLVDNVVLRDPPMGISPLWTNLQRVFAPQPVPCPGEDLLHATASLRCMPAFWQLLAFNAGCGCAVLVSVVVGVMQG